MGSSGSLVQEKEDLCFSLVCSGYGSVFLAILNIYEISNNNDQIFQTTSWCPLPILNLFYKKNMREREERCIKMLYILRKRIFSILFVFTCTFVNQVSKFWK